MPDTKFCSFPYFNYQNHNINRKLSITPNTADSEKSTLGSHIEYLAGATRNHGIMGKCLGMKDGNGRRWNQLNYPDIDLDCQKLLSWYMETQPKLKSSASTYKAAIRNFDGPVIGWRNRNLLTFYHFTDTHYESVCPSKFRLVNSKTIYHNIWQQWLFQAILNLSLLPHDSLFCWLTIKMYNYLMGPLLPVEPTGRGWRAIRPPHWSVSNQRFSRQTATLQDVLFTPADVA